MELLCEKCRRLIDTEPCPFCKSPETKIPESADACYLTGLNAPDAAILSAALEQNGIPFRLQKTLIGKMHVHRAFYVPYGRMDDALDVMQKLWGDDQPVTDGQNRMTGNEFFDADEIDHMEASMLDDLDPEELKAFKDKVMNTLKEIRVQERKWKQRTNILLDMKEEAEYQIAEKS